MNEFSTKFASVQCSVEISLTKTCDQAFLSEKGKNLVAGLSRAAWDNAHTLG